jgi:hypothetical protein
VIRGDFGDCRLTKSECITPDCLLRYRHCMSFDASLTTPSTPGKRRKKRAPSDSRWTSAHSIALAALLIAVIAAAVAVVAWLRPGQSHSYSAEQSAEAKRNVCAAWVPIRKSVWEVTPNPRPGDPVALDAVAANVRLAMIGGGSFLKETVASEPATPGDLAKAVNSVAQTLQWMGVYYLARIDTQTVIGPLKHNLDSQGAVVDKLCK